MDLLKSLMIYRSVLALSMMFSAQLSFSAGGMDGGGGDGLNYRLDAAKLMALEALRLVHVEDLDPRSVDFFKNNCKQLIQELDSRLIIRPSSEVVSRVNGKFIERKSATGFFLGSDILLSRELNITTSVAELTSLLLHEIGHHFGIHDENEWHEPPAGTLLKLDSFASDVITAAIARSNSFKGKLNGETTIVVMHGSLNETLDWSKLSHNATWDVFTTLRFTKASFENAGKLTMGQILGPQADEMSSRSMIAQEIDDYFTKLYLAKYKTGINRNPVLLVMELLVDSNKTLVQFANRIDEIYEFPKD